MALQARLIQWNDQAQAAMIAAKATPTECRKWRAQLEKNLVQLWEFSGDSVGYLLTRVEQTDDETTEWVLVAAAGKNARPVIRWTIQTARRAGFDSIRTHITRPGLQRLYENEGWHLSERVMRIQANG